MSEALKIVSDFNDFYDKLSDDSGVVYRRMLSESMPRGVALRKLSELGINTVETRQVSMFNQYEADKLVVYIDPTKHFGEGKRVCTYNEAMGQFRNYLASKYIERLGGITVKTIQIGKRIYDFKYQSSAVDSLDIGNLIDVYRREDCYNFAIKKPIYSIDFIWDKNGTVYATDYNEVQSLNELSMHDIMKDEEVVEEIIEAIKVYSKEAC